MSRFIQHEQGVSLPHTTRKASPRMPRDEDQIDLLAAPVLATPTRLLRGMVRGEGSLTSQRGAVDVLGKRAWVKRAILMAIATEGPATDAELENRSEFAACGPSSVRKRRSELYQAGKLRDVGVRDKLTLWDLTP